MGYANRLLKITVSNLDKTMTKYQDEYVYPNGDTNLKIGIFGILALMFLVFYGFYPSQKTNFYFFAYTCLYAIFVKIFAYRRFAETVEQWIWCYWAILIVNLLASMCLITGIYRLFHQKINRLYRGLLVIGILSIPFGIYVLWGWTIPMMLFVFLLYALVICVSLKAAKQKQKGAMIIVYGGISVFVAWFLCLLGLLVPSVFFKFYTLFQSITIMALPIAIAIYVGYDVAMTNRSRQEKLKEVENLSVEKQLYLATQNETLEKQVTERTTELNQRIREIIWAVSSDSDNIEGLVHFSKRYVSEFGEMQHIDTQYNASDNLPEMKLSNETKRNLFLCLKEALNNAAKYAKATLIEVSIDVKDGHLFLTIQDNGIGFDIEIALQNGGNGLKNMRERMKQVGGEAFIYTERGCQVVLKLKI